MQCGCGRDPKQKDLRSHEPACLKKQAKLGALVVQEEATAIAEFHDAWAQDDFEFPSGSVVEAGTAATREKRNAEMALFKNVV